MKLKINQKIIDRILSDNDFSMRLALKMGIQQQSVIGLARRNSNKLTLYEAILYFRENGFSDDEIFINHHNDLKTNNSIKDIDSRKS